MNQNMNAFLKEIGKLKSLDRKGWCLRNVLKPETVSGHMYRMAIIAMFAFKEENVKNINMDKVIKLCLVHDMAECIVDDITPYDGIPEDVKHQKELDAINDLSKLLPKTKSDYLINIFNEYEDRLTLESQLTKEIDIYDMILQAFEYQKQEYYRTSILIKFEDMFNKDKILSKIKHPDLKNLLNQTLEERNIFLNEVKEFKNYKQ